MDTNKGKGWKVLLSLSMIAAIAVLPYYGMKWFGGKAKAPVEAAAGTLRHSRPVDIEPIEGIRIVAAENAMGIDREISFDFVDEEQWAKATEVLKDEPVIPLCAFEFDAGMGPQETIPGEFEFSLDLEQMGIPSELYPRMQVWRIGDDGNYYRYQTKTKGNQLCFKSNQNSFLMLALGTAITSYIVLKGVQFAQSAQMRYYFKTGNTDKYDCLKVPVENEDGDFNIYFKFSATERKGGGKAFLDNENAALARVEAIGKEVDAEIEKKVNKAVSGKEDMGWWDRWWLSDKRDSARKAIDREALLQERIAHDPVLTELNSSPDAQLPFSVQQVIQMVKLSEHYLYNVAKVKPLTYVFDVYLLEKRVFSDAGLCVNPVGNGYVGGNPFLYVNIDSCFDVDESGNRTFSLAANKGQSTLLTITHELFHASQQTNYCTVIMGQYPAESMAGTLEYDAARWFYRNGVIKANVDAPDNDNLQMSDRRMMYIFAKPLNEIYSTDKYSILDISSPKRLWEKVSADFSNFSDIGYTLAWVIEAARDYAGKSDRSMHHFAQAYQDHHSSFSEMVRWGVPLSEDKFDEAWKFFCDRHMTTLYSRQYTLDQGDGDRIKTEYYTKEMTFSEGAATYELKLDKKDFYFRTWRVKLDRKSGKEYNLFITNKGAKDISSYVSFYSVDSNVGFKEKGGNKPNRYVKGPESDVEIGAVVTSYSKEQQPDKYYAAALFKPREITLVKQDGDFVEFKLPQVASDLMKKGLITGAEVTFYPSKGERKKLTVTAEDMKKNVKWRLDGLSKEGGPFSLSVHWFYKESEKVSYESPESEKYTFTAVKAEEVEESEPVAYEETEPAPTQTLIRPTLEVPYAEVGIYPYGLISEEEKTYLSCVKSPAVWGFRGEAWADKGQISVTYEGKGLFHIEVKATNGDFEVGKNKSKSATLDLSLYYQMQLGKNVWKDDKYVFEGLEESLSGSYSITFKQYIQCNCEWYDYSKNEWHYDYCTDTATATGSFKEFFGSYSTYMREGSQWSCTRFSGIPLSHEVHDSFLQRVGDDLVPRHIDATLDDLLSLKAQKEAEIAAGGNPFWEGGRGYVTIELDLDLNKYGDADPNDFDYGRRSLTIDDVL